MVRDKNGRFVKGHPSVTPGRPKKEREENYYRILTTTVTLSDWETIILKAVDQAKRGDSTARKFLADYIIGPPIERKEITGADSMPLIVRVVYES